MRLVGIEVSRMLARRMNRVLVIVALGLMVLGAVAAFLGSRAEFDRSAALVDAEREQAKVLQECLDNDGFGEDPDTFNQLPPDQQRALCEQRIGPADQFITDRRFKYADLEEGLVGTSFQFILAMVVIGASAMGAEWNNRTVTTTLTWEPRRTRVFASKVLACALVVFVLLAALMLWLMLVLLPAAAFRGTFAGVNAAWFGDVAETIGRIAALGSLASVFALAIATIGRSTAAALGVTFGYLALFESLVRALKPGWMTWLLGNNIGVVLTGEVPGWDPKRTVTVALLIVMAYAAVVVGGAGRFFRKSDVG